MTDFFGVSVEPQQLPHLVASDLDLHCWQINCLGISSTLNGSKFTIIDPENHMM